MKGLCLSVLLVFASSQVVATGLGNRKVRATKMNADSSRRGQPQQTGSSIDVRRGSWRLVEAFVGSEI